MSSLPPQGLAYAAIKARQRRDTESFREHIRNTPIYREWKAKNPGPEAATFSVKRIMWIYACEEWRYMERVCVCGC